MYILISFDVHIKLTSVDLIPTLSAAWKAKVKFRLCKTQARRTDVSKWIELYASLL